jgi:hypothetical protein
MNLIHTCELNAVNPFDYLTEVQKTRRDAWRRTRRREMPWNYRQTLERAGTNEDSA